MMQTELKIVERAVAAVPDCKNAHLAEILHGPDNIISVQLFDERGRRVNVDSKSLAPILGLLQGTPFFRCIRQVQSAKGMHWEYEASPAWTERGAKA